MRQEHKGCTVFIFFGLMLIVFSVIGFTFSSNPDNYLRADRYDLAWEQFLHFCAGLRYPFGVVGIPMFLTALIVSLVKK